MVDQRDREILRQLAAEVRAIADDDSMPARKQRWYDFNALKPHRPMVLASPEGAWRELLPDTVLQCADPELRGWEWRLRAGIYWWNHIRDDNAIEPYFDVNWHVTIGGYGVDIPEHRSEDRGSYIWDPPIKDLDRDLDKLHFRELSVDREATQRDVDLANNLFGDLLPIRIRGGFWWTMGLTWEAIRLVGLEPLMMLMYDNPAGLHRLMAFLRDEHIHFIEWFEREGLLSHQNECDHTGSGGVAYTHDLPQADWKQGDPVRLIDRWGFAESQETVGVGPEMFAEFVLPYQVPLLEKFGLNCYGCCEPVHDRLDALLAQVPRLRRVSCSPWVDQRIAREKLGDRVIFSRKPNPTQICAMFDEDIIREDLRTTLEIAGAGPLEIIMKDTHTVQNQPQRITRWVEIALEEVDRHAAAHV